MASSPLLTSGCMGLKKMLPWVTWICLFLTFEVGAVQSWRITKKEEVDLKNQLKHLTMDTAKTIKTADGDIFDCVDIYKQPTFALSLLKDHKVQAIRLPHLNTKESQPSETNTLEQEMRPSSYPRDFSDKAFKEKILSQIELEDGGCPQGTIPIQRIQEDTSIREKSSSANAADYKNHWAEIQTNEGIWHGGAAGINVYGVSGVGPRQVSSSLIWVINRQAGAAIKAGWTVHPQLFKDTNTRLFISWSADGERTFCYNLQCPGFVQVSSASPLGMILQPLSVYKGQQYIIRVYVFKDQRTGNWWFSFASPSNFIGYWPKEIFQNFEHASEIHFGGYVGCYSDEVHCPPMGNGGFPSQQNDSACFFQEVQYFDENLYLRDITYDKQYSYANEPECYNVGAYRDVGGKASHVFTFGGPGCYY